MEGMERSGLSLRQTAARIDVSPGYLSRVLNQKRELPSDEVILELAEVLGIDPPELLLIEADCPDYSRTYTAEEVEILTRRFRSKLILPRIRRRR